MAAKVTFDLANKRIVAKAGVTSLDVQVDLYSDGKEDWIANAGGEMALEFPFETDGGRPISPVRTVGAYFFLRNDLGWRVRPDEAHHTLLIDGNLYGIDPALPIYVPTLGSYTVAIQAERSQLTQSVSSEDLALEAADAVWSKATADAVPAGSYGAILDLIRMFHTNRLDMSTTNGGQVKVYDDLGNLLLTMAMRDKAGNAIQLSPGSPALRSKGV